MLGGKKRIRKVPWSYSYLWDAWTKGLNDDNNDNNNGVDWQRIIRQVRRKPWVASFHDHERRGMVLLHLACAMNPPMEAIQAIVEANPAAIHHRGYTGLVPLHIACGRNIRPDVLHVLLLQKDGKKALEIRDNDGMLPIHYACRSDVHHEIMRILLTVQPKLATVQEGDRNMQRASIRPPLNTLSPLTILYNDQGGATPDNNNNNNTFGRWNSNQWNKLKDFVCAAHLGTIVPRNKQTVSILHASLALQCPADVVRVALKIQGEDAVQCGVRDVHGNLPLHYAVSSKALNNDGDDDGRLLSTILHKFPPGASTRDAFARLPLHEGLKSGKRWSDGLVDIYQQYPAAVTIPDRTTEQLAVVLAAEFSDLDATYATLRSYPQAIKMLLT